MNTKNKTIFAHSFNINNDFIISSPNLEIVISFNRDHQKDKNNINIYFNFKDDNKVDIDYENLQNIYLILVSNEIEKYIKEIQQRQLPFTLKSLRNNIQSLFHIKNIKNIKETLNFYNQLHSINIFTIYKFNTLHKDIARTTIELDADILTVVPQWLMNHKNIRILTNMHMQAVYLANFMFLYPLNRIFTILQILKDGIGVIAALIWILFSFLNHGSDIHTYHNLLSSFYFSISYVGVPSTIVQFMPRLIGHSIRKFV